jgi:streptogramin lyase
MRIKLALLITAMFLVGCGENAARDNQPSSPSPTAEVLDLEPTATESNPTTLPTAAENPTAISTEDQGLQTPTEASTETPSAPADPSPTISEPAPIVSPSPTAEPQLQEYPVPPGSHPHDVAPAPDGTVWYTAQRLGELGRLDPATGETHHIPLGGGSAPHGVIVGPDDAAWVTDGGLNAIVRVDPLTEEVQTYPLPAGTGYANLNTATFDDQGILWFTGQSGIHGRLDPATGQLEVFASPRGRGPYGITAASNGTVYYASP